MSFRERVGLRIHLWMCGNCRRFERQVGLMRRLLRQPALGAEDESAEQELSADARERIGQVLAEQQKPTH